MIFFGDDRVTRMVASHIVETDGNGRNVVTADCVGIGKVGPVAVDLMFCTVTVRPPMVAVGSVVAKLFKAGIRALRVCALRRSKEDKAVIADLFEFFVHEFDSLACALCTAERLFKVASVPDREDRLVVKTRITRVGEVIFHPIVPDIIAELFKRRAVLTVVFPHDAEIDKVAVLRHHVAVVKRIVRMAHLLDRLFDVTARAVPASVHKVDTVFGKPLQLPIGRLAQAFVVVADVRFKFRERADRIPALAGMLVAPQPANVNADVVILAFGDLRISRIIVMVDDVADLNVVKPHNGICLGRKAYGDTVKALVVYLNCRFLLTVDVDVGRTGIRVSLNMEVLPNVGTEIVDHVVANVDLAVACDKGDSALSAGSKRNGNAVGLFRKKNHGLKADFSGNRRERTGGRRGFAGFGLALDADKVIAALGFGFRELPIAGDVPHGRRVARIFCNKVFA